LYDRQRHKAMLKKRMDKCPSVEKKKRKKKKNAKSK
jgi:hypothetical protein